MGGVYACVSGGSHYQRRVARAWGDCRYSEPRLEVCGLAFTCPGPAAWLPGDRGGPNAGVPSADGWRAGQGQTGVSIPPGQRLASLRGQAPCQHKNVLRTLRGNVLGMFFIVRCLRPEAYYAIFSHLDL